jgi:hypothetical protein
VVPAAAAVPAGGAVQAAVPAGGILRAAVREETQAAAAAIQAVPPAAHPAAILRAGPAADQVQVREVPLRQRLQAVPAAGDPQALPAEAVRPEVNLPAQVQAEGPPEAVPAARILHSRAVRLRPGKPCCPKRIKSLWMDSH